MFIADYNDRWIRYLTFDAQGRATKTNFGTDPSSGPVQLITGPDTNIYWMRYDDNGGEVRRIRYVGAGNTPPVARDHGHADDRHHAARRSTFNSDQSYDPDAQTAQLTRGTSATARRRPRGTRATPTPSRACTTPGSRSPSRRRRSPPRRRPSGSRSGSNPPLVDHRATRRGRHVPRRRHHQLQRAQASAGGTPMPASSMTWQLRNHHNQHVHFATLPSAADPGDPNRSQGSFVGGRPRRLGLLRGVRHGDVEPGDHRQPVRRA